MLWLWYTSLSMEHLQQKTLIWSQLFLFQLVTDISAITKLLHKRMHEEQIYSLSFPQRNKSASSSYPPSLWTWHLWELKWWNNGLYINVLISGSTVKLKQTLHQRTTGERKWMKTKENCQYSADNLQMYKM